MLDRSHLDKARFHQDNPSLFGFRVASDEPDATEIQARFLSRHVQVSDSLFPEIAATINKATCWLLGNKKVQTFISADESVNAACIPGPKSLPIIWISSGLIKTLESEEQAFVIGHELGHWYYNHHRYPQIDPFSGPRFIARQQLSRAAEISADRFGLITCRNLETALKAAIKTASGLPQEFLGSRVSEFVFQSREIKRNSLDEGELYATHPPMVIRARALMWYSMSDHYSRLLGKEDGGLTLETVNSRVEKDLTKILGEGFVDRQSEDIQEAVFWMTVYEITKDGEFLKKNQKILGDTFGEGKLQRLKTLFADKHALQVKEEMLKRALEACEAITAYSNQAFDDYLSEHRQVAKYAADFLRRFDE